MKGRNLKSPILLIGNVRSGTTMIQSYLSHHPDLVMWFEPRTVWAFADPGRRHDRFTEADASSRVIRYIRNRFLRFQEEHGEKQIVEKTPSNTLRIPYVHRIFPESKLIYIIRNPLDQISSTELEWKRPPIRAPKIWRRIKETPKSQLPYYLPQLFNEQVKRRLLRRKHKSVWGVRYPGIYDDLRRFSLVEVNAMQWVKCAQQAEEDLSEISSDGWLFVRYEDVVRDPVPQFERMFRYLNIGMSSSLRLTIGDSIRPNLNNKWKRMDPDAIRRSLSILSDPMMHFGYVPPSELDLENIDSGARSEAEAAAHDTSHGVGGV